MVESKSKERSNTGEWTSSVSDSDVLEAIEKHEPAATSEVADEIGMTRQGAGNRLKKLLDNKLVNRKMIGSSAVWYQD